MDDRTRQWLDEMTIDGPTKKWTEPDTVALRGVRSDLARVTAERDRLASIQEDWHTVVRALGRDPGTEHETGRASDDIFDAARILRAQKPGLLIDEAATSIVAERDAAVSQSHLSDAAARAIGDDFTRVLRECSTLRAEVEAMRAVVEATSLFLDEVESIHDEEHEKAGRDPVMVAANKAADVQRALDALRARKVGG